MASTPEVCMVRVLLLGLGVCVCLLTTNVSYAQSFNPNVYYQVQSRLSGKCLDIRGVSVVNGGELQQYDCPSWAYPNQLWTVLDTGSGSFRIVSANTAKCVDVPNASTANGVHLQQYDCNLTWPQWNQVFTITPASTAGYYRIASVQSSSTECLDVEGMSTANEARVQQWACGPPGWSPQDWAFVPVVSRQPLTHVKSFEYYFHPVGSQWTNALDHANTVQYNYEDIIYQPADMTAAAAAGLKFDLVLGDYLVVRKPRNGDIYANTYAETGLIDGGLLVNYEAYWNNTLRPAVQQYRSSIRSFYMPDEPYNFYGLGFSFAEIDEILTRIATLMKRDFPEIPIQVVDGWIIAGQVGYPALIDWVGFDCYDCNTADYMARLNGTKAHLQPNQSIVLVPKGFVSRDNNPSGNTATTQAEQDDLVAKADFYINIAISEPRVTGVNVFIGPSTFPPSTTNLFFIGTWDMPTIKAKWRFLWRALGSGAP